MKMTRHLSLHSFGISPRLKSFACIVNLTSAGGNRVGYKIYLRKIKEATSFKLTAFAF